MACLDGILICDEWCATWIHFTLALLGIGLTGPAFGDVEGDERRTPATIREQATKDGA